MMKGTAEKLTKQNKTTKSCPLVGQKLMLFLFRNKPQRFPRKQSSRGKWNAAPFRGGSRVRCDCKTQQLRVCVSLGGCVGVPGTKGDSRCTYDGYGLPDESEPALQTHVFAATAGRPQAHHVLRAEEQHQHDLL